MRVGVVQNRRSHRNRNGLKSIAPDDALSFAPDTPEVLADALRSFAEAKIDLLIVDGGDGTVRDVLSIAFDIFGGQLPLMAVVPHGKTNALARDLGVPARWSIEAAIAAARTQPAKRRSRPALHVVRPSGETLTGFIFGAGAFVNATRLARRTHRAGLFNSLAVGVSLVAFFAKTLAGGRKGVAAGEPIVLGIDGQTASARRRFVVLASTLERMPLRMRPFGPTRSGLKVLDVDAPPRGLLRALPPILTGRAAPWLEKAGYRRLKGDEVRLSGIDEFVLDGEILPGGDLVLRQGPSVEFVTA